MENMTEGKDEINSLLMLSVEKLVQKAIDEDWKKSKLDFWISIKIAHLLEKISALTT